MLVETSAGVGSGFHDSEYKAAGAKIVPSAQAAWGDAEIVVKVKEPLPEEYGFMRDGLICFTYLHLAADKTLTEELLERRVSGIGYETIELSDGSLPLLIPMSEVA